MHEHQTLRVKTRPTWSDMTLDQQLGTLNTMRQCGGGFASRLADAWAYADLSNGRRLAATFPELVERFGPGGPFYLGMP